MKLNKSKILLMLTLIFSGCFNNEIKLLKKTITEGAETPIPSSLISSEIIKPSAEEFIGACHFTPFPDPTDQPGFQYKVVFSEEIDPTSLDITDFTNTGTGGALTLDWELINCGDDQTFKLRVIDVEGDGRITPTLITTNLRDKNNEANFEAPTWNTNYRIVNTSLNVQLEKAQAENIGTCSFIETPDYTNQVGFSYKVFFSLPIDPLTFDATDLLNTGSGGSTLLNWQIDNCGDDQNFKLTASAITGDGTIIPSIDDGVVQTTGAKLNTPSTTIDSTVVYDTVRPDVLIQQDPSQIDPTGGAPVRFQVQFSEEINLSSFSTFDIVLDGISTTSVDRWSIVNSGDNQNFVIVAEEIGGDGVIVPRLSSGSVRDLAGNSNNSPTYGADNEVTIDSTLIAPPTIEQQVGPNGSTNSFPIEFIARFNLPVDVSTFTTDDIVQTGTASGVTWTIINTGDDQTFILRALGSTGDGTITPTLSAGSVLSTSASGFPASIATGQGGSVNYDTVAPTVMISQDVDQADPTAQTPVVFNVNFNEAIDPTSFSVEDIFLDTSATGVVSAWEIVNSGDNQNFELRATSVGTSGTIIPRMQAGRVYDLAGNSNALPTYGTDNQVLFDNSALRVVINQYAGGSVGTCGPFAAQADPTNNQVIRYLVTFDKDINASTLASSDFSNIGTGGATQLDWSIQSCGDTRNYLLETSAVVGGGTIVPTLAADLVQDSLGNFNRASTSSDNSVLYSLVDINVTVEQHPGGVVGTCPAVVTQVDPVSSVEDINYLVNFSQVIDPASFVVGDIVNTGSGGSVALTWQLTNCGDDQNFLLTANSITGDGTIIPIINNNSITDLAGNVNLDSTSVDNSVLYDVKGPEVVITRYPGGTYGNCALIPAQSSPARNLSLKYLVQFDEVIDVSTFDVSDIVQGGTGGAQYLSWAITNCGNDMDFLLEAVAIEGDGTITPTLASTTVTDINGNPNSAAVENNNDVFFDAISPSVTIEKHPGGVIGSCSMKPIQSSFTNDPDINFVVEFSEAISPLSFTSSDIVNTGDGGAGGISWSITNCGDDTRFLITTTSINGGGEIIPKLERFAAQDPYGNGILPSTSVDNIVKYDQDIPTVTINQALTQGDPTAALPIRFDIKFSEEIDAATFDISDITLAPESTVTVGTWNIINKGDNQNFILEASDLSGVGIVAAQIGAGRVQDFVGFNNSSSTSEDNQITYELGWYQEAYLKAANASAGDRFGASLSFDGQKIIVGASGEDGSDTVITNGDTAPADDTKLQSGAAYIYRYDGTQWIQEAYLKAVNSDANDSFGSSVAIDGDLVAVGAVNEESDEFTIINGPTASTSNTGGNKGAVYIYRFTAGSWVQEAYLKMANGDQNSGFGHNLSLYGETLVVGSPTDRANVSGITNGPTASTSTFASSSGAAFVYAIDGGNWVQQAYIKAANNGSGDNNGIDVSLYEDTLAVGAHLEDSGSTEIINGTGTDGSNTNSSAGAVHIYRREDGFWVREAFIKPSNNTSFREFGKSLSLYKNRLAVAAPRENNSQTTITQGSEITQEGTKFNSGAVYIFRKDNDLWTQEAYIKASNGDSDDYFGDSVSLHDDALAVSSVSEDSRQNSITNGPGASTDNSKISSGAVYVYQYVNNQWVEDAYIKALNVDRDDEFGSEIKLFGNRLVVGAPRESSAATESINAAYASEDNSAMDAGAVYVYRNDVRKFNPTELAIVSNDNSSIELSWQKLQPTAVGFKIAYLLGDTAPADCSTGTVIDVGDVLTFTITGLEEVENYSFRVCSYDAQGIDTNGVVINSNTTKKDIEVAEIFLADRGVDFIDLNWNEGDVAPAGYRVNYFAGSTIPAEYCTDGTTQDVGTLRNLSLSSLTVNETYNFRVCSYDGLGVATKGRVFTAKKGWYQESYIKAFNSQASDLFGTSVDMDGDTLVVGANGEDHDSNSITDGTGFVENDNLSGSGAVYVYTRTGAIWSLQSYIKAVNSAAGHSFGSSVSIDGDTIVVGARGESAAGTTIINGNTADVTTTKPNAGAAFVYTRTGSTWEQEAYIKASNSDAQDYFASKVSLSGDTLAVSATHESSNQTAITNGVTSSADNTLSDSGAIYIYKRNAASWSQEAFIKPSNSGASDLFGSQIDLDGDLLAVGVRNEDSNQTSITSGSVATVDNSFSSSGATYLYKRSVSDWFEYAYIKSLNNNSLDYFGSAVALSGNRLAVGAEGEDSEQQVITNAGSASANNDASSSGAVYIFRQDSGLWVQEAYIKPSNSDSGDSFGSSLDIVGDTLVVGASGEDGLQNIILDDDEADVLNEGSSQGALYVFKLNAGLWTQEAYLKGSSLSDSDMFGNAALKISGNTIVAGVSNEDGGGSAIYPGTDYEADDSKNSSGAVFVFRNFSRSFMPDDFSILADNGADVTLKWGASPGATGYTLAYLAGTTAPADCTSGTFVDVGNVLSYTFTGLAAADYSFRICPYGDSFGGSNGYTLTRSGSAVSPFPNNPTNFTQIALTAESIQLDWVDAGAVDGYLVAYQSGDTAPLTCNDGTVVDVATATTLTVTGLDNFTNYSFRVCSYDGIGNISTGVTDSQMTPEYSFEVAELRISDKSPTTTTLDWDNPNGATGFIVAYQQNTAPSNCSTGTVVDVGAVNQHQITGLDESLSYVFRVCAYGASMETSTGLIAAKRAGWHQDAYLKSVNSEAGDNFGYRTRIYDNTLAIAATGESSDFSGITNGATASASNLEVGSGAVYLYERVGLNWVQQAYIKSVFPGSGDDFGAGLDLGEDILVVGAPEEDNNQSVITNYPFYSDNNTSSNSGAVFVFEKNAGNWAQTAYIKNINSRANHDFGWSVAVDKTMIAVGLPGEDYGGSSLINGDTGYTFNGSSNEGAVIIYSKGAQGWFQEAYIKSNLRGGERFGFSVDLKDNTLVVGAPNDDSSSQGIFSNGSIPYSSSDTLSSSGSVYTFDKVEGLWVVGAAFKPSASNSSDNFGYSVAYDSDFLAVGTPGDDHSARGVLSGTSVSVNNSASGSGAVYLYKRENSQWAKHAFIKSSNSRSGDAFGTSVALDYSTLVVGAPGEDSAHNWALNNQNGFLDRDASNSGAAYIYKLDNNSWSEVAYLKASNPAAGDSFGQDVFVHKNMVVVGAHLQDSARTSASNAESFTEGAASSSSSGAAYVFRNDSQIFAVSNFKSEVTDDSITLNWDGFPYPVTGYKIVYLQGSTVPAHCSDGTVVDVGNVTTYTLNSLNGLDTYSFRICAYSATAEYSDREVITSTTLRHSYDVANIELVDRTETSFMLSWFNAGAPVTAFKIAYAQGVVTPADCSSGTVVNVGNVSSYELTGLDFREDYSVRICAVAGGVDTVGETYYVPDMGWYQEAYIKAFNTPSYEVYDFGYMLKVDGEQMVIATPEDPSSLTGIYDNVDSLEITNYSYWSSGALHLYDRVGDQWTQDVYIKFFNAGAYLSGIYALDLDGNRLVAADESETSHVSTFTDAPDAGFVYYDETSYSGGVYVYEKVAGEWEFDKLIKSPRSLQNWAFGSSVSLSGDTLAIGSRYDEYDGTTIFNGEYPTDLNDNSYRSGAGYIYNKSSGEWVLEAYIKAYNADDSDNLGHSISLSGNTLAISAPSEDSIQNFISNSQTAPTDNELENSGAVYVYHRVGNRWHQQAYLKPSNSSFGLEFGQSLSLEGDRLAVGAPNQSSGTTTIVQAGVLPTDSSEVESGAVYMFKRTGSTWEEEAFIKPFNAGEGDRFGFNVSLNGNRLAVASPNEDSDHQDIFNSGLPIDNNNKSNSGAAYVFNYVAGNWVQEAYLKAKNSDENDYFGGSVSLDGSTLAVSAWDEDSDGSTVINGPNPLFNNDNSGTGAVYVFRNNADKYAPSKLMALSSDSRNITLRWTKRPEDAGYKVVSQMGFTAPTNCDGTGAIDVGWVDRYTFTNLTPSVTYSFLVCSYDTGGNLNGQQSLTQATSGPPIGPKTLAANDTKTSSSLLQWTPELGVVINGYRVAYKTGLTPPLNCQSEVNLDVGLTNEYRLTGLLGDNAYSARVCPYDANGIIGVGKTVTLNTLRDVWFQEAYIKAANADPFDRFGDSVDIYADTLVVGAPGEDSLQTVITQGQTASTDNSSDGSGAVYVYRRNFETWTQEAFIKSNNADAGDFFGKVVNVHKNILAVSASLEDSNQNTITNGVGASADNTATDSGAVYLYEFTDSGWAQQAYLKSPEVDQRDYFGHSLSLSENLLAVGAYREDSSSQVITNSTTASADNTSLNSGAAYIFEKVAGDWVQSAYLKSSNSDAGDFYGFDVAVDAQSIVVGAPKESSSVSTITNGAGSPIDNDSDSSGAAYVYIKNGGNWEQQAYLKASNNNPSDYFGYSVDIRENTIAVGAPREDSNEIVITNSAFASSDNSEEDAGAVYVFNRVGSVWDQVAYVKAANSQAGDQFGYSVKLGEDTLVVGAPFEDSSQRTITLSSSGVNDAIDSGAVYVYRLNGTEWVSESYIKSVNALASQNFGHSLSMSGDTVVVSAPGESADETTIYNSIDASFDNRSTSSGAVYVYRYIGRKFEIVNLLGEINEDSNIELSWNRLAYAFGYRVTYQQGITAPATCSLGTSVDVGSVDQYVVPGLTPGETYSFRVCGYDDAGDLSDGRTVTLTKPNPPMNPLNLVATPVHSRRIDLSWDSAGGTTSGFIVSYLVGETAPATCSAGTSVDVGAATTAIVDNFDHYATLSFRVCAYNATMDVSSGITTTKRAMVPGWYQEAYIKANTNYKYGLEFGGWQSLGLSGNTILGGAEYENHLSNEIEHGSSSFIPEEDEANSVGAVFVFERTGTNWEQTAYLKPSNPHSNMNFGDAMAIDGDVAVIGAPRENSTRNIIVNGDHIEESTTSSNRGAIYVYRREAGLWEHEAYIKPSNNFPSTISNTAYWLYFGQDVDIHGDTIVVGVSSDPSNQTSITNGPSSSTNRSYLSSGAVFVYRNKGQGWYQESYIKASNAFSGDSFGESVEIHRDTIVVGASGEDSNQTVITAGSVITENNSNSSAGAAYIFKRTGDEWSQEAYIKAANADSFDYFGRAVTIYDDTAVILAPSEDSAQNTISNGTTVATDNDWSGAGAAYVYKRSGTTWQQEAYIKLSNTGIHPDWYSYIGAVSLHGDTLVIGNESDPSWGNVIFNGPMASQYGDGNNSWGVGSVFVYRRQGVTWEQEAYIQASNAYLENYFGAAVEIDGDTIAVSSPYEGHHSTVIVNGPVAPAINAIYAYQGAIYVYRNQQRVFEPTSFVSQGNTLNSIDLTWGTNTGNSTGYFIVYNEGSVAPADCNSGTILDVGNVSSHTVTGLLPDREYAFRICSYDSAGNTSSGVVIVTETESSLKAPLNFYAQSSTPTEIDLSWENQGGSGTGFQLAYNVGTTYPTDCLNGTSIDVGNVTTYNLTGLTSGDTVSLKLCSYDASLNYSEAKTAQVKVSETGWYFDSLIKAPIPDSGDFFGEYIAANDDYLAIGVPQDDSDQNIITTTMSENDLRENSGAVHIYKNVAGEGQYQAYIKAANASENSEFGKVLSLYKDRLAVGQPLDSSNQVGITNGATASVDISAENSGAVYIYAEDVGGWTQQAYIKAANAQEMDEFGSSVSLKENLLLVGAPKEDSNQSFITNSTTASADNTFVDSGAAYLYSYDGALWEQEAYIKSVNGDYFDSFGSSVSIGSSTSLAIAAPQEDSNQTTINNDATASANNAGSGSGAVYVYRKNGSLWEQEAYLKASNADGDDQFGSRLVFDNDTIAVSSVFEDSNSITIVNGTTTAGNSGSGEYGAVYIFRNNLGTWAQEAYLKAPNGSIFDYFGDELSFNGHTLVVGVEEEDSDFNTILQNGAAVPTNSSASKSGAVYIFQRSGVTWTFDAFIKSPHNTEGALFGRSISFAKDTVFIGSPKHGGGVGGHLTSTNLDEKDYRESYSGSVYLFKNNQKLFEPSNIEMSIGSTNNLISWTKAGDLATGYIVAYQSGNTAPADCASGTVVDVGDNDSVDLTALTSSTQYSLRICSYDASLTSSEGSTFTFETSP